MRIAVSGTHCTGKTTLIDEFLRAHPDFGHEPEPYTVMVEDYGEDFCSEPGVDDFYRQLEFMVDRLQDSSPGARVIYERSPVDFLAYILALKDLSRDAVAPGRINAAVALVLDAVRNLDLIVFLPLDDAHGMEIQTEEDPKLRRAADSRLVAIFGDDEFNIVSSESVSVVEARGSIGQRLRVIEDASGLDYLSGKT